MQAPRDLTHALSHTRQQLCGDVKLRIPDLPVAIDSAAGVEEASQDETTKVSERSRQGWGERKRVAREEGECLCLWARATEQWGLVRSYTPGAPFPKHWQP